MKMRRKTSFALLSLCAFAGLVGTLAAHSQAQEAEAPIPRMASKHLLFVPGAHCIACHSQVHAKDGEDISIGFQWRASVMANAARDPYWQASIRRETMDHPANHAAIEDKCATCHMPMQRYQARAEGETGEVLKYLETVSSGKANDEPDGDIHQARNIKATLSADGVSCTVCHQIKNENLGQPSSLDGGFLIDVTRNEEERQIFGPFDDPDEGRVRMMNSATGYIPKRADYIKDATLCATCHTLYTAALDDKGNRAGTLPEQVPFQEWQHSDYANKQSCQDCHMTEVAGANPITSVHAQDHTGVMRHIFVGGNALLLSMLDAHRDELGVIATPDELAASGQRSDRLLREKTASVSIADMHRNRGHLVFTVKVENHTGHKFPTAYPSRRAWLHVTVRDGQGHTVFESGHLNPDGSITGNINDADPTKFEPHFSRITSPGQVEVYESILGDFRNRVTTGLLYGTHYLKDNRVLPTGFDKGTADQQIAVIGDARTDPAFTGGQDRVTYDAAVGDGAGLIVTADLLYESIGYRWAHNLEPYHAPEPDRFVRFYDLASPGAARLVASATATNH